MTNSSLIDCQQLRLNEAEINHELDFVANAGNIISIIGPDQDDKSHWLKTIAGVISAASGQLNIAGKAVNTFNQKDWVYMRTQFAYVHANTAILSAANALQNMMLPAMYHKTGEADAVRGKAQQLLQDIDAGDNLERLPAHLKKEQRYKIAIARALILDPKVLFLDDAFSAIERPSMSHFYTFLLNKVRNDNLLLVLVSHDTQFTRQHSDQIIYISEHKMLQFDKTNRIQDCNDPEIREYLSL